MKLLLLLCIVVVSVSATCPLNRALKIKMYQFLPDLGNDGFAGLKTKLQNDFQTTTGCTVDLDFSWDINTYDARQVKRALQPCTTSNPAPQCGFDMVEIDTATLDDLVSTPNLLQPMPFAVRAHIFDFIPSTRRMVRIDGVQWAQPSYACDNLFFSYEDGLQDVSNRDDLINWIDSKINGNSSRLGYTADLWAVWDLTTAYVDAHLDTFPFRPLCCGTGTAYSPNVKASIASGLADLAATCRDNLDNTNPCLDSTFYNDYNKWFGYLINGRSVMQQGFSTNLAFIREYGGSINDLTIQTATLGDGSQSFLFTDAFVLSKSNCPDNNGCVNAATLWLNWQRLEGQITINLGRDVTPNRPRYLVSANMDFYTDSRTTPYANIYNHFYNPEDCDGTLQLARPLNVEHFTDQYCDQYAALTAYVNTGSSCAAQGKANQTP